MKPTIVMQKPRIDELEERLRKSGYTSEEKIDIIKYHFGMILETLGLDLEEEHLKKTPYRFAKMLVNELLPGLKEDNFPSITLQDNEFEYREMLIDYNISIKSICEHHFMPILGYCHIAYIPDKKIIGLSKLNRIAQFIAGRPQIQERMTKQIREILVDVLGTEDVGVVVDAKHLCVRIRGIQDVDSYTRTSDFSGKLLTYPYRKEFITSLPHLRAVSA